MRNLSGWWASTLVLANALATGSTLPSDAWAPLLEPSVGGRVTSISVSPHDANRVLLGGDMLGVALSVDGGERWESTRGFASWEIGDFTWHPSNPDRVWVGTMGGPYESVDGGRHWSARRTGLPPVQGGDFSAPIEVVLYDPNDNRHLLAFGGSSRRWRVGQVDGALGAVWESRDEGASWARLTTLTADGSADEADAVGINIVGAAYASGSSQTVYATVDGQGVYRSTNGGVDWGKFNAGLPQLFVERVVTHPALASSVFVSLSNDDTQPGGVYRSDEGGAFVPVTEGLPQVVGGDGGGTSRYQAFAVDGEDGTRLLAVDDRFGSDGVFLRDAPDSRWRAVLSKPQIDLPYPSSIEMEVAEIAASDRDVLFAAGSANLIRSVDGGATWEDGANVTLGEGRYRGRGFSGLVSTALTPNPLVPGHLIAQGFDGARVLQTYDGGESWTFEARDERSFNGGAGASFASAQIIYASLGFQNAFEGIARSIDGGTQWEIIAGEQAGLPAIGDDAKAGAVYASRTDTARVWVIIDADLYASIDGGDSWQRLIVDLGQGCFAASPDETRLYVSGDDAVWVSEDGMSFSSIGGPGKAGQLAMAVDGTLWFAAHDGTGDPGAGLWRYTALEGWRAVLDPTQLEGAERQRAQYTVAVDVSPVDPSVLAISTADPPFRDVSNASGPYFSRDGGESWRAVNANLPLLRASAIRFDPHDPARLYLGTDGRGFYTARILDTDNDRVDDAVDNCSWLPNVDQRDTDGDGFGNRCDPDLNNDGQVDGEDLMRLRGVFLSDDADADFNGDGIVDRSDLRIMRDFAGQAPGPGAV